MESYGQQYIAATKRIHIRTYEEKIHPTLNLESELQRVFIIQELPKTQYNLSVYPQIIKGSTKMRRSIYSYHYGYSDILNIEAFCPKTFTMSINPFRAGGFTMFHYTFIS